jgi:hypothetical protein
MSADICIPDIFFCTYQIYFYFIFPSFEKYFDIIFEKNHIYWYFSEKNHFSVSVIRIKISVGEKGYVCCKFECSQQPRNGQKNS